MNRRSFWDAQAREWGESYGRDIYDRLRHLIDSLDIGQGESVADLGCGTGILFPHIAGKIGEGGTVLGIDYSAEMLKKARRKTASAWGPDSSANIFLAVGDARSLPVRTDICEVLTCFGAFAHFQDKRSCLLEMHRLLKPGGKAYIIHLLGREQLAEHHHQVGGPVEADTLPDEQDMRGMLEQAGFVELEITDSPNLYLVRAEKR